MTYKERTERVKQYKTYQEAVTEEYVNKSIKDYAKDNGYHDVGKIEKFTVDKLTKEFNNKTKHDIKTKSEIEGDAINHLTDSDRLMCEAEISGLKSKDYYKIATTPKDKRTAATYEKALEGTEIKEKFDDAFFKNGCDKAVAYQSKYAYDKYTVNGKTIGRDEGIFVMPMDAANTMENDLNTLGSLSKQSKAFRSALAKKLGLPCDAFDSGVVRLEVPIDKSNLHMPIGMEEGANAYWVPGGKTPNDYFEGVRNQITEKDNPDLYQLIIHNVKGATK